MPVYSEGDEVSQEESMELTQEQIESIQQGKAVKITVSGTECVVLSQAAYQDLTALRYDDMDPREAYPGLLKAWDAEGSPADADHYKDLA
jgi:hypothetical protein